MDTLFELEDNLLLFFTGFSRSAGSILQRPEDRAASSPMTRCCGTSTTSRNWASAAGRRSRAGRPRLFGELMHEHWEHKKPQVRVA